MIFKLTSIHWIIIVISAVVLNTLKYLIFFNERKLSNGQLWQILKGTALTERTMFLFHWYQTFKLDKLCLGMGTLFRFFGPGAGILHWKAVPGARILTEKISGPVVSLGDGNWSNWYLHIIRWNLYFQNPHNKSYQNIQFLLILYKYFKSYGRISAIWPLFGMGSF